MAGNPALESAPVTQEPYRNRDCEGSGAHSFCHAKYTHVSQTLWRRLCRLPRIHLPRTWMNKGKILRAEAARAPGPLKLPYCAMSMLTKSIEPLNTSSSGLAVLAP